MTQRQHKIVNRRCHNKATVAINCQGWRVYKQDEVSHDRANHRPTADAVQTEIAGAAKTAEIEAALQGQDIVAQDFERSLQTALASTGGTLLFQMRIEKDKATSMSPRSASGMPRSASFSLWCCPPMAASSSSNPSKPATIRWPR